MYDFRLCTAPDNVTLESCEKNFVDWYCSYMLERFICVSGIEPDTHLIDRLFQVTHFIYCQSRLDQANF